MRSVPGVNLVTDLNVGHVAEELSVAELVAIGVIALLAAVVLLVANGLEKL